MQSKTLTAFGTQKKCLQKLYQSLIHSVLASCSETWTLKKEDKNRLLVFEMTCLRKISIINKLDKIRNTTIRKSLDIRQNIIARIQMKRLRCYGHVMRMSPQRLHFCTIHCIKWTSRRQDLEEGQERGGWMVLKTTSIE